MQVHHLQLEFTKHKKKHKGQVFIFDKREVVMLRDIHNQVNKTWLKGNLLIMDILKSDTA